MQREIKFRVWNKLEKRIVQGSWIRFLHTDKTLKVAPFELDGTDPDDYILMQYTGLKDKNGVEIYEGDIVKIKDDWEEYGWKAGNIGYIIFEKYYIGISLESQNKPDTRYTVMADVNNGQDIEVIGNIYQSKHLLDNTDTKA